MSNHQDSSNYSDLSNEEVAGDRSVPIKLKLHLCLISEDESFTLRVKTLLDRNIYDLTVVSDQNILIELTKDNQSKIDCLLLKDRSCDRAFLEYLQQVDIFLPAIIVCQNIDVSQTNEQLYHSAETKISLSKIEQINEQINIAISKFLNLTSDNKPQETSLVSSNLTSQKLAAKSVIQKDSLALQQHRLTEKLKERLGYLGVYYKRDSQDFYRNLSKTEQKKLRQELATEYQKIILNYFDEEQNLNQIIDRLVNLAFFSDISVSVILEIHMELMDEFAKQLKLEGRNEDILLDYRLALIDIIAHLCEMYRRSIPREDISLDLLLKVD